MEEKDLSDRDYRKLYIELLGLIKKLSKDYQVDEEYIKHVMRTVLREK